jgi:Mg-chelatase subunit ChlD
VIRRTQRNSRPGPGTWRPLERKPKQLTAEPALFQLARGPGGAVLTGQGHKTTGREAGGSPAPGITGEKPEQLIRLPDSPPGLRDQQAYDIARQIARRLSIRRPRKRTSSQRRGTGTLASMPYHGGSDDVDLDQTIEILAERPVPEDEDIIVRERIRTRRWVVLAVDISGSMRGERVRNAAATVGALAGELHDDQLAVIAFWSDAVVLLPFGSPIRPLNLLDDLLRLPARGLTNIAFPLELAQRQLMAAPRRGRRVILLTDAVHNAGPDPRQAASGLHRVDVLLDTAGEHDLPLAREIATAGHGILTPIRHHRDIAPALTHAFST